jgi:hypothetical protein
VEKAFPSYRFPLTAVKAVEAVEAVGAVKAVEANPTRFFPNDVSTLACFGFPSLNFLSDLVRILSLFILSFLWLTFNRNVKYDFNFSYY